MSMENRPTATNLRLQVQAPGLAPRHVTGALAAAHGALAGAGVPLSRCLSRLERRSADRATDSAIRSACDAVSEYFRSRGIPLDGVRFAIVVAEGL